MKELENDRKGQMDMFKDKLRYIKISKSLSEQKSIQVGQHPTGSG